jgi:hypothetical protein
MPWMDDLRPRVSKRVRGFVFLEEVVMKMIKFLALICLIIIPFSNIHAWPIPDTGQAKCFDNTAEISCPSLGESFYG